MGQDLAMLDPHLAHLQQSPRSARRQLADECFVLVCSRDYC